MKKPLIIFMLAITLGACHSVSNTSSPKSDMQLPMRADVKALMDDAAELCRQTEGVIILKNVENHAHPYCRVTINGQTQELDAIDWLRQTAKIMSEGDTIR